jgi:prolipoprotein diacylglyceryl transferase
VITSIPSPSTGVWWLGPLALRAYALCILAGIIVAVWVAGRRLYDRGAASTGVALDISGWAVPFGLVGARIYHVITTWQPYFGEGGHPIDALKIWHGGLGIWGAIAFGAVGAWIGCRRKNVAFLDFADAAAPGILVAQAFGRWGNYFNNELYGHATDVPWALQIHEWDHSAGAAVRNAAGQPIVIGTFQPTFLYEAIWCLLIAAAIVLIDRRRSLGRGRAFFLYVMLYPVGRVVFELMRTDPANHIFGQRVNVWVCALVFLAGLIGFLVAGRRHPDGAPRTVPATGPAEPTDNAGTADTAGSAETADTSATDTATASKNSDDSSP